MPGSDWRSRAGLEILHRRAELFRQVRSFFAAAGVLEVDTPILGERGVTDPHINCIEATVNGERYYLQSSPEYYMKRLLAQGSGAIYYLGKVFRDEEQGRRHRPEFTMLEWYRPDWDERQLIHETGQLLGSLANIFLQPRIFSYREVFQRVVGLNPHSDQLGALSEYASKHCGGDWSAESRGTLLDLLFSTVVEPSLPDGLVFIHDYPACQCALARLCENEYGETIARRFELFYNRMEIGNGYSELTDPVEQRSRFMADRATRLAAGQRVMEIDEKLLQAMGHGLPDCAGVAIGVDRLLMQITGKSDIADGIPFG